MDTRLERFWFQVTNREWQGAFFALNRWAVATNVIAYVRAVPELFTLAGAALIAVGAVACFARRRALGLALLLTFGAQLAFWLTFEIGDLSKHLLPSYLILAIWLGIGAAEVLGLAVAVGARMAASRASAGGVAGPALAVVSAISLASIVLLPGARGVWLVLLGARPVDYTTIERHIPTDLQEPGAYARSALRNAAPNSTVFAPWRQMFTLAYVARYELGRQDVLVTRPDHFDRLAALRTYASRGTVYFVEPPLQWAPADQFVRLTAESSLYVLERP
jgi:hypothetical protein